MSDWLVFRKETQCATFRSRTTKALSDQVLLRHPKDGSVAMSVNAEGRKWSSPAMIQNFKDDATLTRMGFVVPRPALKWASDVWPWVAVAATAAAAIGTSLWVLTH